MRPDDYLDEKDENLNGARVSSNHRIMKKILKVLKAVFCSKSLIRILKRPQTKPSFLGYIASFLGLL